MGLFRSRTSQPAWRDALTLALVVTLVLSMIGCGGHAPVEAQELHAAPSPTVTASPTVDVPTPTSPATTAPAAIESAPSEAEPTATVYDPFVPKDEDDEAEQAGDAEATDEDVAVFDATGFSERIAELVGEVEGELEIVVSFPDGTLLYERDSTEPMESASLYKLAIMVELFRQRELGELAFDESIVLLPDYFLEDDGVYGWEWIGAAADLDSLLRNMITLSSNVAAAALLARLGNDAINETMADLGLHDTVIRWTPGIWVPAGSTGPGDPEYAAGGGSTRTLAAAAVGVAGPAAPVASERADEALNVTTAADVAALFQMLLNGEVVSAAASEEMLELLARQQVRDRIPRYLPEETVIAHKTGNWDGLVHDAGVIWSPHGPVIVVILSDIYDEGRAVELIANVALEAYLLEH